MPVVPWINLLDVGAVRYIVTSIQAAASYQLIKLRLSSILDYTADHPSQVIY
jgi:hypothetical protein